MPIYNAKILTRAKELYHREVNEGKRPYIIDLDTLQLPKRCRVEWEHDARKILGIATNFRRSDDGLFCNIIPHGLELARKNKPGVALKISPTIGYKPFDSVMTGGTLEKVSVCVNATDDGTFLEEL